MKAALDGMGAMDFQRLTSQGKFAGCELTYRRLFRDYRANKGDLVAVFGSISSPFIEGKNFGLFLKARTAIMSPRSGERREFQPAFAALSLGTPLAPFKTTEFKCEDSGICIVYGDNTKFELLSQTMDKWLAPGPTVTVATSKGGYDTNIKLLDILDGSSPDKEQSAKAFMDFHGCLREVMKSMIEYLEKPTSPRK